MSVVWSCACFVCFGTYSENIGLAIKNSLTPHTTLRCIREYFDCITHLSHLQQLESQNLNNSHTFSNLNHRTSTTLTEPLSTTLTEPHTLINSHTYSAAKHCSSHSPSHSHTISAVHLHILMSSNGLLTL